MKKTLIALAVLVAAGSVNAAEVYNKDGATFALGGKLDVQMKQAKAKDSNAIVQLDDAEFNFALSKTVTDDVKVVAYWEFDAIDSNQIKDNAGLGNAWAGFETTFGTLTFGKDDTVFDGAGVGNDYEFGTNAKLDDAPTSSEHLIKYAIDKGQFYAAVSTIVDGVDGSDFVDGKVGARFGDFDVRVFFLSSETAANSEYDVYAIQAQYSVDAFDVEISFADGEKDNVDRSDIALGATYNISADWAVSAGYDVLDIDDGSDKVNTYFANVEYMLANNSNLYFEVGGDDKDNTDVGYVMGLVAKF